MDPQQLLSGIEKYHGRRASLLSIRPALKELEEYIVNPPHYASSSVSKAYRPVYKKLMLLDTSLSELQDDKELVDVIGNLKSHLPDARPDSPMQTEATPIHDHGPPSASTKYYGTHQTSGAGLESGVESPQVLTLLTALNDAYDSLVEVTKQLDELQTYLHRLATHARPEMAVDLSHACFGECYAKWFFAFGPVWAELGGQDRWSAVS